MSAEALFTIIAEGVIAVTAIAIAWYFASELDRLNGEHAARASARAARARLRAARARQARYIRALRTSPVLHHTGHHRAGAALVLPLPAAQVIAQAEIMQRAAEEHLPALPQGQHPYVPLWEVTPEEWRSYCNAGKAVEPVKAAGHAPWTGSQPALTPEAEAELMRQRLIQEEIDARGPGVTAADLREILDALRDPAFGVDRCEADVLAAEAALPFPYDPDYDNCAGEPHGSERVFYKWYGMEQTACPRCWTNMFGAEPDPSSVRTVPQLAVEAEAGAQLAERLLT